MQLTWTERPEHGVTIVALIGSLTHDESGGAVHRFVRQQLEAGQACFLIDLAGITEVDSFGLGELVTAMADAKAAGGLVKLLYPGMALRGLLLIISLTRTLEMFDNEAKALCTFPPPFNQSTVRSEYFVG